MELIEYWYLLLRRKWIILASLVLFSVGGVGVALLTTPIYQSEGKLLFVEDQGLSGAMGMGAAGDMMLSAIGKKSDPLMTQIEIMKTRPILDAVIHKLELKNDSGEFIPSKDLKDVLGFSVVTNTNVIKVSAKNKSSKIAADIVNTLAEEFITRNLSMNRESATAAKLFIEQQMASQRAKLDKASSDVVDYKKEIGTVSLEQETTLKIGRVAQLETELIRTEGSMQGLAAEKQVLLLRLSEEGVRNSSFYSRWKQELSQIESKILGLSAMRLNLRKKIGSNNRELNTLPLQEVQYANLIRDKEIAKGLYTQLLEQYEQFKIKEAANISSIKVIEPAVMSEKPIEPQKRKIVMLAMIAGFMLGFGIALLLEYLDDSPRSIEEIKKLLPYNLLGVIPYFDKLSQLYVKDNGNSFAAESLRLVQANMKYTGMFNKEHYSMMLSSSQPGEGKTTTSANLALSFAELGYKTVLVNMDLRRPTFSKVFDQEFKVGVTDYLVGDADLEAVKYSCGAANLTIIPAGTVPPNPTVLIGTAKMNEMHAQLKEEYDLVIFDTPPVTMVAETLDFASKVDGIVLVVDGVDSSVRGLKNLALLLEGKALPLLGMVVNKMGKGNSRYSYYGQYGYQAYSADS
ncbi:polysaccharide biosynthesis tyrosine autokinase [Fibrobacterales bacterium]|nr:polysaccharide biosynthesis tyrosine autokinase [Fibrobacterales bacterium]